MSEVPFVLSLDSPTYYGHDIFPNRIYRSLHARHHDPLNMHALGLIARLGVHAHHLAASKRNGELCSLNGIKANAKNDFEVHLDVGLFQPEELTVKLVNDSITIEGKHEEREDDHGHVSRHFVRRYVIPKGYDADAIESTLSSDGVLNVRVPKILEKGEEPERLIPIKQVGPSDLFVKPKPNEENGVKSKDDK